MSRERSEASAGTQQGVLWLCAVAHAVVDGGCGLLLWRAVAGDDFVPGTVWAAFFFYNMLAFAIQPLVGLAVDKCALARRHGTLRRDPASAAAVGALMVAAAVPFAGLPHPAVYVAVALCGLGNAVFHVGGGVVSLRSAPGKAAPVGFFVAPGAAGVTAGILLGKDGFPGWPFVVLLSVLAAALLAAALRAGRPRSSPSGSPADQVPTPGDLRLPQGRPLAPQALGLELTVLLLLGVVCVRSYVGLALHLPWKSELPLLLALTALVVGGKALGGVLADRLGWRQVGVGALLVSAPLLALGASSPAAGLIGIAIFNFTMPVTLVAVAQMLPGREGFAFGLTCLALFVGAAPVLAGWAALPTGALLGAALAAAAALWAGLTPVAPHRPAARPVRRATDGAVAQGGHAP